MLSLPLADGAEMRGLEPWQAAEFATYVARHRDHLAPWLPWGRSLVDEQSTRDFLQRYADGTAADGRRIYSIWLDDELVGGTLFRIFEPAAGACEIGVWLAPDAGGRGLVTRAATAMIDWAVAVRGMRRIEWRCVPENVRSQAVAHRLGMSLEGTLRDSFHHDDRLWDTQVWAVLSDDWHDSTNPTKGP